MKKETTKEICSSCGTSQVNHKLMFALRAVDTIVSRVDRIYNPVFYFGNNARLVDFIEKVLLNSFYFIGLTKYSDDLEKAINGRSKLVWEEARRRGIEMRQLIFLGKPLDHFRANVNGKIIFFNSIPTPPWMPRKGYGWVDNKFTFARKIQEAKIPSPKTRKFFLWKDALRVFDELEKPMIIKPELGSLGRHTTTNINTKEDLKKAFDLARQITFTMVAQEHLFGSVYRATVVNNVLVGFFRADPPFVVGDGTKTVKELIAEKNKNKPERVSDILISPELLNFISRQNYEIESVLENGKKINLIAKTGRFYGGYTKEILPEVHPKFHEIFKKAGEFVSIPVAGFDLIIEDPMQDPDTQRWGIIECNTLPFIDLHAFPLEGEPVNIAKYIWDLWDIKK